MQTGRSGQRGFAYVGLLALLAVLLLMAGVAAEHVSLQAKRQKEAELIFIGRQFRNAIAHYHELSPPDNVRLPRNIGELLADDRFPKPARHLRKVYVDPMTGRRDWGQLRNEHGELIGVFSLSQEKPIKTTFDEDLRPGIGPLPVTSYAGWRFIYIPREGASAIERPEEDGTLEMSMQGR